ncbi:MAG: hypothetical protein Q8S84_05570 [bacterium]|nr:hypothetical protein [bacterium]
MLSKYSSGLSQLSPTAFNHAKCTTQSKSYFLNNSSSDKISLKSI